MSRPTKCTPDVTAQVCGALRLTDNVNRACVHAGISKATFYEWIRRGKGGEEPFVDFLDATMRAREESVLRLEGLVLRAAERDWRCALEILRRRDPDHWAVTRTEHAQVEQEPETHRYSPPDISDLPPEKQQAFCDLLDAIAVIKGREATEEDGLVWLR